LEPKVTIVTAGKTASRKREAVRGVRRLPFDL
jgi:hypothetical protein